MASLIQLLTTKTTQSGVLSVTFSIYPNSMTPAMSTLIADFGEPLITIPGTFTPTAPTPAFTLPSQVLRVVSDLPYTQLFDPSNPALSATYLIQQGNYYITQFNSLYEAAITALAAQNDTWSSQAITSYP